MTRKFAYPGTVVPGARLAYDDKGAPLLDKKGRRVWHMPKVFKTVEHRFHTLAKQMNTRTKELRKVRVPRPVQVSIYRGMDARLANWYRGQARRETRKRAERIATAQLVLNDVKSSEDAKIIAKEVLQKHGVKFEEAKS